MSCMEPAPMTFPPARAATRSQIEYRLSRSCVTMNTVRPSVFCSVPINSSNSAAPIGSRPEVGSSRNTSSGIEREGSRQRRPLDHAARQFRRKFVRGVGRQAHELQFQHGEVVHEPLGNIAIFAHRHLDVLPHREAGEQRAVLKQHAPALFQRAQLARRERVAVLAKQPDHARALAQKPKDGAHQHRFSLARAADKAQNLAAVHVEIEPVHDLVLAELHHEVAHADHDLFRRGRGRLPCGVGVVAHGSLDANSGSPRKTSRTGHRA